MTSQFQTKTSKAFQLLDSGKEQAALAIFKTFKMDLTETEKRAIQITHECKSGRASYYASLDINIAEQELIAKEAINKLRSK